MEEEGEGEGERMGRGGAEIFGGEGGGGEMQRERGCGEEVFEEGVRENEEVDEEEEEESSFRFCDR